MQWDSHQRMPILVSESLIKNRIFHVKVSPHTLLTNYKGENSKFIVDKSDKYHLNKVTKVNITNIGTNMHLLIMMVWEHIIYVVLLPTNSLLPRKYLKNLSQGTFPRITGLYSSKVSRSRNTCVCTHTQRLMNCFQIKGN